MAENRLEEVNISRAILERYHGKIAGCIESDVIVAGAGPSGLVAAIKLTDAGFKVTVVEKRLSPGGGIWGGAIGMNEAVVQDNAIGLLDELGIAHLKAPGDLHTIDAMELASGLCFKAIKAGATLLNLMTVEDVCIHDGKVSGVVVNQTMLVDSLPVDPMVFSACAVIDATGHEAAVVRAIRRRGLLDNTPARDAVEGPMNAIAGEAFVVERAGEVYPGLWVTGMCVSATFSGPRMGPIFGGMLLSGERVAQQVADTLKK